MLKCEHKSFFIGEYDLFNSNLFRLRGFLCIIFIEIAGIFSNWQNS